MAATCGLIAVTFEGSWNDTPPTHFDYIEARFIQYWSHTFYHSSLDYLFRNFIGKISFLVKFWWTHLAHQHQSRSLHWPRISRIMWAWFLDAFSAICMALCTESLDFFVFFRFPDLPYQIHLPWIEYRDMISRWRRTTLAHLLETRDEMGQAQHRTASTGQA